MLQLRNQHREATFTRQGASPFSVAARKILFARIATSALGAR
jgi:hypothetical protein